MDTKPIRPNLSHAEPIKYKRYQICTLSETEPIGIEAYQIPIKSPSKYKSLDDHQPLLACPVAKVGMKQDPPTHPSSTWLQTFPAQHDYKPSQLNMTTNPPSSTWLQTHPAQHDYKPSQLTIPGPVSPLSSRRIPTPFSVLSKTPLPLPAHDDCQPLPMCPVVKRSTPVPSPPWQIHCS